MLTALFLLLFCLGCSLYQHKLLGVFKTYRIRRESRHHMGDGYSALCIQLRKAQGFFFHFLTVVLKKCSLEMKCYLKILNSMVYIFAAIFVFVFTQFHLFYKSHF